MNAAAFEVSQPVAVTLGWHAQANRGIAHDFSPRGFFCAVFATVAVVLV